MQNIWGKKLKMIQSITLAEFHSKLDNIVKSTQEQRDKIVKLQLLKSEALLCAKNYESDIFLLKKIIMEMKQMINSRVNMSKDFPLSQEKTMASYYKKRTYFSLVNFHKFNVNDIICSVKYSDNGYFFVFATYKTIYLYDSNTKLCINSAPILYDENSVKEKLTRTVCINPSSSIIAICAPDFSIILYRIPTLKLVGKIHTKSSVVSYINFFNDNERIVSSGEKGKVIIWSLKNLSKEREVTLDETKTIAGLSITFDDLTIIATCSDGSVFIFDSEFKETPRCYNTNSDFIFSSAYMKSGSHLAMSLKNNEVKMFSLIGGLHFSRVFVGHSDFVVCVEFSNNGKLLLTGSKDESMKIWDIETAENLWSIPLNENTVFCISHHPKRNEFVACTGDGTVTIFTYVFDYH